MKRAQKMLVLAMMTAFVATALFFPGLVQAGDLEPINPPGPTMKTLEEVYTKLEVIDSKLDPLPCEGAPVEKTGQTESYAPGDDGDLEKGVTWPVPRFRDNGDGTVTDNLTGLIWLKNANCFGTMEWDAALEACNNLADGDCGLTDGSTPGDWRLPNRKELESLLHLGYYDPALPNTEGTGQWTEDDPFTGVQSSNYWSSTTFASYADVAWGVYLSYGFVGYDYKTYVNYVWPVRGRQ